jgi:ribosomal protein S26
MSSNDAGKTTGASNSANAPNTTDTLGGSAPDAGAIPVAKICVRCGMDLNGKPRLKDKKGYWCAECAEAERRERLSGRPVKCEECGRTAPRDTIVKVKGRKLCDLCADGLAPESVDASDSFLFAQKLCSVCTKDVTNEKRLWNGKSYVCIACHEVELESVHAQREARARERSYRMRCLQCGNKVPADTLVKVDGLEICQACVEVQQAGRRKEARQQHEERPASGGASQSRFAQADSDEDANKKKKIVAAVVLFALLIVALYLNGTFGR